MDRQTRHQLKHDEFKDTLAQFEDYFKQHYKEIINISIIVLVVVGLAAGLKYYTDRQEAAANADLGEALATLRAYVGQPTPGQTQPGEVTYTTAQEKYKKALQQFDAIVEKYKMPPRPQAVAIALYQAGVCQALLNDQAGAIRTLTAASGEHDAEIAAMAKFALAGVLAKSGKTPEAAKLYQELADHPTITVPKASALLALADAYRESQPAKSRQIYEQVQKEFASNSSVAQAVKQQIASLTP
ncbi:MAG: tetratricopeptide repeat protein [Terriglobia bacterium]